MERVHAAASPRSRPAPAALPEPRAPMLVPFAIGAAVLLAHALLYRPFFADDALISLRYARRLLDGQGLTWTDGPPVEGYSNLLWVLLLAGLGRLGMDLILAARILGGIFSLAALAAVAYAAAPARGLWVRTAPLVLLAACGSLAAWLIGGLEQPLFIALFAWAIVLIDPLLEDTEAGPVAARRALVPALLFGLLCLTRPDAPLLVGTVAAALWAARGFRRRALAPVAVLLAIPLAFVGAHEAFRLAYYHSLLPNTAHAKLTASAHHLRSGLRYVGGGTLCLLGLLVPVAWGLRAAAEDRPFRRRLLLVVVPMAAWSAYLVVIGGDIFPARRHQLVPTVLAALLAARMGALLGKRLAVPFAVGLALLAAGQIADPENRRAREERWEWDGQVVGLTLKAAFGPQRPLIAVDPAGCVPYFSGLPALDMLGLNDRVLARSRPAGFDGSPIGHERGNGAYVLACNPDLVLFSGPAGGPPDYPSGRMMVADPAFHRRYREIAVEARDPRLFRFRIWMRREGGAIGIERDSSGTRVHVPGYLCADGSWANAIADSGLLAMSTGPGTPALLSGLPLGPGKWTVRPSMMGPRPAVTVRRGGETLGFGIGAASFVLSGADTVDLAVEPADAPGLLLNIVLARE